MGRDAYEIIVVDGNSSDNTCDIAAAYADKLILQNRPGIGGARRDGADLADGHVLVFTDADTRYNPQWLSAIAQSILMQKYDASTGPTIFSEMTLQAMLLQLWRMQYHLFHIFNYYRIIGSNMAVSRDAYERVSGHRAISLLEDYDLSMRLFLNGGFRFHYDPRQIVYTSSRRMQNLLTYTLIFLYGHYHYHITRDYNRLLQYPKFSEMRLASMMAMLGEAEE